MLTSRAWLPKYLWHCWLYRSWWQADHIRSYKYPIINQNPLIGGILKSFLPLLSEDKWINLEHSHDFWDISLKICEFCTDIFFSAHASKSIGARTYLRISNSLILFSIFWLPISFVYSLCKLFSLGQSPYTLICWLDCIQ